MWVVRSGDVICNMLKLAEFEGLGEAEVESEERAADSRPPVLIFRMLNFYAGISGSRATSCGL